MRNLLLSFFVILLLSNCSSNHQEAPSESFSKEENYTDHAQEDNAFEDMSTVGNQRNQISEEKPDLSSSASEVSSIDGKKFIRTANIKYRVKNVRQSTTKIEDITRKHDGFVTYTNLQSDINNITTTAISADSSLETMYFTINNTITLRVPNHNLDQTLKDMSAEIDYLDFRTIRAQDISISYLSNELKQKRIAEHNARVTNTIDEQGKKIKQTLHAEDDLLNKKERQDLAHIANLELEDKVEYSTVELYIYQRQGIKRELIENYKNTDAYQPSFTTQLSEGISTGWNGLKSLIIGLANIWPLIFTLLFGFIFIKNYRHIFKKKQ